MNIHEIKTYFIVASLSLFSLMMNSQTNNILPTGVQVTPEGIETPVIVTNKFNIDYPNNDVQWQMDGDNYAVHYTDAVTNIRCIVVYDSDGNLLHKDREIDNTRYPNTIGDYYRKNYPDENYTVWVSEDNKGNSSYYVYHKSTVNWFDKKGRYITTKNKEVTKK